LIKTPVSNSTFDRGSLSPTYVKPFDVFAKGSETGDWLAALDDFRNWLIREALASVNSTSRSACPLPFRAGIGVHREARRAPR
jgi:hypothetical protein